MLRDCEPKCPGRRSIHAYFCMSSPRRSPKAKGTLHPYLILNLLKGVTDLFLSWKSWPTKVD